VKPTAKSWKSDFPIQEEVEDFSGKQRSFVIRCHEGPLGYTVRASEVGKEGLAMSSRPTVRRARTVPSAGSETRWRRGLATRHVHGFTRRAPYVARHPEGTNRLGRPRPSRS